MKNWTKTALLTGCACCIAGAALMFCGWTGGGKAYAETYDLNAMSGSATKADGISVQGKTKIEDFDELLGTNVVRQRPQALAGAAGQQDDIHSVSFQRSARIGLFRKSS